MNDVIEEIKIYQDRIEEYYDHIRRLRPHCDHPNTVKTWHDEDDYMSCRCNVCNAIWLEDRVTGETLLRFNF